MSQYQEIRTALEARLAFLQHRIAELEVALRRSDGPRAQDFEDHANEVDGEEVMQALDDSGRKELTEIEAALARMDAGTYGICERTGKRIPLARLKAIPTARYTIPGADDDD
ncbi:MAG: TraR/DksA family transcriptional regulator [Deltaproteobacteria bacterium]|nr:TraR/DksA family transcriptional regulator [Deltaproteobacteria bacterium]